jgi:hypothetical protein
MVYEYFSPSDLASCILSLFKHYIAKLKESLPVLPNIKPFWQTLLGMTSAQFPYQDVNYELVFLDCMLLLTVAERKLNLDSVLETLDYKYGSFDDAKSGLLLINKLLMA